MVPASQQRRAFLDFRQELCALFPSGRSSTHFPLQIVWLSEKQKRQLRNRNVNGRVEMSIAVKGIARFCAACFAPARTLNNESSEPVAGRPGPAIFDRRSRD